MKGIRKWLKWLSDKRTKRSGNRIVEQGTVKKAEWLLKLKESIFVPDAEIGWLPFALYRGWRCIRNEKIDLIYSTSRPYTDHLIALFLKKWSGKPWIADFRDPWSLNMIAPRLSWRRFTDKRLEQKVLRNADLVLNVTRPIERDFRSLHKGGHYQTITNGYDDEDFEGLRPGRILDGLFNITYTGILFRENSPDTFFSALALAVRENPELRTRIRVRIVGQLDNPGESENSRHLASLDLGDMVEMIPYTSHRESLDYALSADTLLLIINNGPHREGIMTSKVFEYLRCGNPVLAVVPSQGTAADLIRETGAGIIVNPDSVEEIKKAILLLYSLYRKRVLKKSFRGHNIGKYSRENLTGLLAQACDSLVSRSQMQRVKDGEKR